MLTVVNKMDTIKKSVQKILLLMLKDFSKFYTATSLAKALHMSRWGIWKILKKLEEAELILLKPVGEGKTSSQQIALNWDNSILEKVLSLLLSHEARDHKRWMVNFTELEKDADFLILYGSILHSPKEANDIDVITVASEKRLNKINETLFKIQETQVKKIHSINLTNGELKKELNKPNKALINGIKKGVVLYGQERFVKFMGDLRR